MDCQKKCKTEHTICPTEATFRNMTTRKTNFSGISHYNTTNAKDSSQVDILEFTLLLVKQHEFCY